MNQSGKRKKARCDIEPQTVDKLDKIEFAYSLFLFKIFINRNFRGDG